MLPNDVFITKSNPRIRVPVGAKKYYEASDAWNKFEIVEDETVEAFVKVYTEGRERVLTLNEFSLKNLVYNINQIKFALDSRADRRDRSFFKAKWFIL